jgi:hypothetical protein
MALAREGTVDKSREGILAGLRKIDTPTITNTVATYPDAKTCLALYDPWTEGWYRGRSRASVQHDTCHDCLLKAIP